MPKKKYFKLKINLSGSKPVIWREIIVPVTFTLMELHAIIQGAMGWQDSHLHGFMIDGARYEPPFDLPVDIQDESHIKVSKVLKKGTKFVYEYDFGDGWKHSIVVADSLMLEDINDYMLCLAGENSCPPENCGGVYSYGELLPNISAANDEEFMALPFGFAPEIFSISQANSHINAIRVIYELRDWGFKS